MMHGWLMYDYGWSMCLFLYLLYLFCTIKTLMLSVFRLFCEVPEPKDTVTCEILWKYLFAAKAWFFSFLSCTVSTVSNPSKQHGPPACHCWQALSVSRWWSRPHLYWESRSGPSRRPDPTKKGGDDMEDAKWVQKIGKPAKFNGLK